MRTHGALTRIGITLAVVAGSAVLAAAPPTGAAAEPGAIGSRADTQQSVLLELDTEAAAPAWRRAGTEARRARRSPEEVRRQAAQAGADQRGRVSQALDRLADAVHRAAPDSRELYRTRTLLAGLAVTAPAGRLPALRALPGVRAVHPITRKERGNAYSVPLTGAPAVWSGTLADAGLPGNTGAGVRIGIIDSGIDYTHADFGGPGTEQAFRSVERGKPAPAALFPNSKVIGGKDLVGDDYNPDPSAPNFQPVPHPGPNPLDCALNGHGTHVAGTAAGLGVTSAGKTYTGPYHPGLDPAGFKVGPGAAPGAQLYAIRVFGCDGSTDQLAQALDLAADPNGNGDLSDRLDVVNLSLGSRFGNPDDTDALAADRLAELGTVVVAAAGNEGDVYGVGGSPGNAARAIDVAASVDGHADADGIRVLAPEPMAGLVPAHWSAKYQSWSAKDVSAELALPVDQSDGCAAFDAADAARLKGRIAVLSWHTKDPERACGSAPRADHAAAAGAVGTLFAADGDHLGEIAGDDRIPAAIMAKADGERLVKAVAAGPVRVQLAVPGNPLHGAVVQNQPLRADTLTSFTSRGVGLPGLVKPDVAAPGETIWSARVGTGSGGMREDGTSMASPHITGLAALVRSAHPGWSPAEVKAALMNTAGDTWLGDDHTGPVYGPERTGAGRARVDLAVRTPAVAYAAGEGSVDGAVGVSFGPVPVTGPTEQAREVEIRNFSDQPLDYTTGYLPATEVPGARFDLSPAQVTVPAGGTTRVTVTLRVPGRLGRAPDPTIDLTQTGHARSYRAELSGRLLLTPVGADVPALRVPLFAAPRPASELSAGPQARTSQTSTLLSLTGTGAPAAGGDALISAFALGGEAARWPDCPQDTHQSDKDKEKDKGEKGKDVCVTRAGDRAANLRTAGAATDAPAVSGDPLDKGMLYLAATFWAPSASPVSSFGVRASLDTDGDGVTDVIVVADRLTGSDVLVARALDARTGKELDVEPLNARWGDTDTDLLDSDTVVLPVRLSALPGLRQSAGKIRYALWTGLATQGGTPGVKDAVSSIGLDGEHPTLTIDALHPALDIRSGFGGPAAITTPERPGSVLEIRRMPGDSTRLLLVHHFNPDGRRAEILG
ncbi:S8 family serine peptidase [Kitasatospora sp. MAP5-34]|uniref:S8 family serine peptidase n=1 Tax=Kitasatospora sp. MAP5-34 TaxID=3035102 RepID=UPI002476E39C|nr:S8 family serine peptidase [Kitasatospora sp. MAP5-34]MDH6579879.1 subtilisin family serine protease [Kitasatospora sp. MAP5-34]